MAPRPVVGSVAEDLFAALGPWAWEDEASATWQLLELCQGIGVTLQDIEDVIRDSDQGPGWSAVLDADRAPAAWLPWLAQFVGVRLRQGLAPEVAREAIKGMVGFRRGSPGALRAAAQQYLTGNKYVIINERVGGNAYQLAIRTITAETPDPDLVLNAILEQKPAGIVLDYATVDAHTYDTLDSAFGTYDDVDAAYTSYDNADANL